MSQALAKRTTGMDIKKCPRDIVLKLRRVALEKDISYQEVCLEAFKEYLARNKALYEKEIVITT